MGVRGASSDGAPARPATGFLLRRELEARGIKVRCNAQIKANLEDGYVEAVLLDDGTIYDADIGVMAVGIRLRRGLQPGMWERSQLRSIRINSGHWS